MEPLRIASGCVACNYGAFAGFEVDDSDLVRLGVGGKGVGGLRINGERTGRVGNSVRPSRGGEEDPEDSLSA